MILGGGFAGMLTAVNLLRRGITDFRIVEKGGDFGGTWYWNRYPGCMCDVESYIYLPLLEETGYMPTERYASASEIFAYCQRIGRHFGLYERALFQTQVDSLVWDDDACRWDLVTTRGDRIRTRFFVAAGGLMHKAKLPGIAGIERFRGKAFHTSRWDYAYTGGSPTEPMDQLADKVVGIIGTGATAVQVVPQLAKAAKEVYVFQRTPSAVGVRGQRPTDPEWFASLAPGWQAERTRNFTEVVTGGKPDRDLVADGWSDVLREDTQRQRRRRGAGRRARGDRLRGDGGAAPARRRGDRRPGPRRAAEALVRQALQADLLPRRVPAGLQPAERPPRRHRRLRRARDVAGRAGRGRHRSTRSTCWCSPPGSRSPPGS